MIPVAARIPPEEFRQQRLPELRSEPRSNPWLGVIVTLANDLFASDKNNCANNRRICGRI